MFGGWRRKRRMSKVKKADGKPLKRFRWWHAFYRTRFLLPAELLREAAVATEPLPHVTPPGGAVSGSGAEPPHPSVAEAERTGYVLDVDYLDGKAWLYADGVRTAVAEPPALFPVPGGAIDVQTTTYGMRRAHLVLAAGGERQLLPHPATAEAWRARLAERLPGLHRVLGAGAVVVLLLGLVLGVPQLVELVTHWEVVQEHLGWTFTSPVNLPAWANTTLGVGGVLASFERALTLRYHWFIDLDTTWFGD